MAEIKDVDRPFQIFGVLDGKEGFHSGYFNKTEAEQNLALVNQKAAELGIKTRYIFKEIPLKVVPPVTTEKKEEKVEPKAQTPTA